VGAGAGEKTAHAAPVQESDSPLNGSLAEGGGIKKRKEDDNENENTVIEQGKKRGRPVKSKCGKGRRGRGMRKERQETKRRMAMNILKVLDEESHNKDSKGKDLLSEVPPWSQRFISSLTWREGEGVGEGEEDMEFEDEMENELESLGKEKKDVLQDMIDNAEPSFLYVKLSLSQLRNAQDLEEYEMGDVELPLLPMQEIIEKMLPQRLPINPNSRSRQPSVYRPCSFRPPRFLKRHSGGISSSSSSSSSFSSSSSSSSFSSFLLFFFFSFSVPFFHIGEKKKKRKEETEKTEEMGKRKIKGKKKMKKRK
jgi:hypothetical protein